MKTVPTLAALIPVEVALIMVEVAPIMVAPVLTPARIETVGKCIIAIAV